MTNLEEWKENEKQRLDGMSVEDVIHELINRGQDDFCFYCINHKKDGTCNGMCSEGLKKYFESEREEG